MTVVLLVLAILVVWIGVGAIIAPRVGRMLERSRQAIDDGNTP